MAAPNAWGLPGQSSSGIPPKLSGQPPAPGPPSFAQALRNAQGPSKQITQASSTQNQPRKEPLKLKRWPKNKDPKVLLSYLQTELKNANAPLFLEIAGPDTKTEKRLILMRGLPGSGKSALSTLLVGVTEQGVIFSADDFFLDRRGIYRYNPQDIGRAHEVCRSDCKKAMEKALNPIVIDNTNTQMWEMLPYVEMALNFQYRVHVVEPTTPWRNNVRTLTEKNSHGVPFDRIKAMLERYDKNVTPQQLIRMVRSKQGPKSSAANGLDQAMQGLSLR